MSVMLNFSMSPLDKGESVSKYVARSLDIIDSSGLAYSFGPMSTSVETGDWDQAMTVVKDCFEKMRSDCRRIVCTITVDYREGPVGRLKTKVGSVEGHLGKSLDH